MPDPKKATGLAAIVLAAHLSGHALHAQLAPALPRAAHPVVMRWLDEGPGKANRFAIGIETKVGANFGEREIVCEADGSAPKLNGVPITDTDAADLCKGAAVFGNSALAHVGALASMLVK